MPKWNFSLSGLRTGETVGESIFSENFIIFLSEQVLEESPDKSFTSAKLKPGTFVSMILERNYNADRNQKIRSFETKKRLICQSSAILFVLEEGATTQYFIF